MVRHQVRHPLPASPIKGEVSAGDWGWIEFSTELVVTSIEPQEWRETSHSMGEVGGGDCSMSPRARP